MGAVGGARHYDGEGLGTVVSYICPACGTVQSGAIGDGCGACGAGRAQAYRAQPLPPPPPDVTTGVVPVTPKADLRSIFEAWQQAHPQSLSRYDAFFAGFALGQTWEPTVPMTTAPVFTEAPMELTVDARTKRTILAALAHYRDAVLPQMEDLIATGELCTDVELQQIIKEIEEGTR